jgi:hypothetical protein
VELVERSIREGKLFSEMEVGWGRPSRPIEIAAWLPSISATSLPPIL